MTALDYSGATPPLDDFLAVYNDDDNEWWRIECGHHMNLFEAAVDERDEAREAYTRLKNRLVGLVTTVMGAIGGEDGLDDAAERAIALVTALTHDLDEKVPCGASET